MAKRFGLSSLLLGLGESSISGTIDAVFRYPGAGSATGNILDSLQTEYDGMVLDFENNKVLVRYEEAEDILFSLGGLETDAMVLHFANDEVYIVSEKSDITGWGTVTGGIGDSLTYPEPEKKVMVLDFENDKALVRSIL